MKNLLYLLFILLSFGCKKNKNDNEKQLLKDETIYYGTTTYSKVHGYSPGLHQGPIFDTLEKRTYPDSMMIVKDSTDITFFYDSYSKSRKFNIDSSYEFRDNLGIHEKYTLSNDKLIMFNEDFKGGSGSMVKYRYFNGARK